MNSYICPSVIIHGSGSYYFVLHLTSKCVTSIPYRNDIYAQSCVPGYFYDYQVCFSRVMAFTLVKISTLYMYFELCDSHTSKSI